MKQFLLIISGLLLYSQQIIAQCNTNNATSCACPTLTATECNLLPDLQVSWLGLTSHNTSFGIGPKEFSQSGNGVNDGRLRISVSTPNIGLGPLTVRGVDTAGRRWFVCGTDTVSILDPNSSIAFICPNGNYVPQQLIIQRVYRKNGNTMIFSDRFAGTMTYHANHGHNHVDNWASYTLRLRVPGVTDPRQWPQVGNGSKIGFCLMDYGSCNFYNGHCRTANDSVNAGTTLTSTNFPNYGLGGGNYGCSQIVQGISSGFTDIYSADLDGMWIDIPSGICNGQYYIVADVDPDHHFTETDTNNNYSAIPVNLTLQSAPGTLSGYSKITSGSYPTICPGNSIRLFATPGSNYLWSTGDTTQFIDVSTNGSYTVTVTNYCGTETSSPFVVNVLPNTPSATAADVSTCKNSPATLTASGTGDIQWLNANGNWLANGPNFTTAPLVDTTMFLVSHSLNYVDSFSTGHPSYTTGSGSHINADQYLIFRADETFKLKSFKIHTNTNGLRTITLTNNAGNPVRDTTLNLAIGLNTVNLNWNIPGGGQIYHIKLNNTANCFRTNSGVTYPYSVPGVMSITGSSAGSAFYYWFYDWKIEAAQRTCSKIDTVWANVLDYQTQIQPFGNEYVINANPVTLGGTPAGGVFSGAGVSGNIFTPQNAGPGFHNIVYTYTGSTGCSQSDSQLVRVIGSLGIAQPFDFETKFKLFPNPAQDFITFELSGFNDPAKVNYQLYDITGRLILDRNAGTLLESIKETIDLSAFNNGVYILNISVGESINRSKIIIKR